ncbi:MAG: serine/threonine protein kinase [Sandaracinaceae bacterium]|nr:serine/threonine protein kinase [Sandaracinaceae bacterium]
MDIYDVGSDEKGFYLIMEFLRGRSLADRLEQGPMTLPEFLAVMRGVCAGLAAAHHAGIVHRDLKPDNIFLAEARNDSANVIPKIVDFGVSKAATHTDSHARLTGTGVAMGTPHYMSPEQVYSAADAGPQSDIYSLGVIAYEALSGALPHDGDTVAAIIVRVATEGPSPSAAWSPAFNLDVANAIHRALAKKPQDRYQTVGEFFAALSGRNTLSEALAATIATPPGFQHSDSPPRNGGGARESSDASLLPSTAEPPGPSTVEVAARLWALPSAHGAGAERPLGGGTRHRRARRCVLR